MERQHRLRLPHGHGMVGPHLHDGPTLLCFRLQLIKVATASASIVNPQAFFIVDNYELDVLFCNCINTEVGLFSTVQPDGLDQMLLARNLNGNIPREQITCK